MVTVHATLGHLVWKLLNKASKFSCAIAYKHLGERPTSVSASAVATPTPSPTGMGPPARPALSWRTPRPTAPTARSPPAKAASCPTRNRPPARPAIPWRAPRPTTPTARSPPATRRSIFISAQGRGASRRRLRRFANLLVRFTVEQLVIPAKMIVRY